MSEMPVMPNGSSSIASRIQVAVDLDTEPVDWDHAVARFLLTIVRRESRTSVVAPLGRPSDDILCIQSGSACYASPIG